MVALSPRGIPIQSVDGNEEGIRERGRQLDRLSTFLLESAEVLGRLSDAGAVGQDGKAIARITEIGDEVSGRLRKVGNWYGEVAPHVREYGRSVRRANERIAQLEPEIRHYRDELREARDERNDLIHRREHLAEQQPADAPPSGELEKLDAQIAEARERVIRLKQIVQELGDVFDSVHDRWEEHFEEAADGISSANREHGMRDRRRGVFIIEAHPLPAITNNFLNWIGCGGRGPFTALGPSVQTGWHHATKVPEFVALTSKMVNKPREGEMRHVWLNHT